ncbi:ATP-dependent RNA helicase HrpA [Kaarinaea lacus]
MSQQNNAPNTVAHKRIASLKRTLSQCTTKDKFRLLAKLRKYQQKKLPIDSLQTKLDELELEITKAHVRLAAKKEHLPVPEFPDELPICQHLEDIKRAITNHQVVVIAGETGSGKTTQIPKICLSIGRGISGMIGHTQPRRIAARSIAARIADELKTEVGQSVGYHIRFSDRVSEKSYIKLMTDGILLAEIQNDRYLNAYDTIIIDEAHERSLNIDFLLGYFKQLLPKRPDLKLIITSATIDVERFSQHFNDAPIIEVSGRTYPVEVRYRPLLSQDEDEQDRDMQQAILDAVDELSTLKHSGDVLIFLSGEREIRDTAEALRKHHPPHTQILPLYSRQSASEQNRVFQSSNQRRLILATNVAETSLTVPGIRYVVDPGFARISRYSYRSKVQRLPIEKISQSSANQRKGRCGRVSEGVCIRLYSEEEFLSRPEFTDPEIIRTNLAAVILQMEYLRLGAIEDFPFLEAPDQRYINDGYKLLEELGALKRNRSLTAIGKQLAKLPMDPRIGRMLIAAQKYGCLSEVLVIASALSSQDPRERPLDAQQKADEKHQAFVDDRSDFIFFLNLWTTFQEKIKHLSNNKLRKYCHENFLSYLRMKEWRDVYKQLHTLVTEMGWRQNTEPAEYSQLHKAILAGLISNVGFKSDKYEYQGQRNVRFYIHPGSILHKNTPKWIMAAEIVETTKLYARLAAKIESQYVEEVASHLLKRSYYEAHWEKKSGYVVAYESVSLYGLIINPKRRVNYGPIDAKTSREIFIRAALVERQLNSKLDFYVANELLISEVEELEAKARRRDILIDDQNLIQFYEERLPHNILDQVSLQRWYKTANDNEKQALFLSKEFLTQSSADQAHEALFPDHMLIDGLALPLSYHFEPGHPEDGVTVNVPAVVLQQLPPEPFEWLVPGMLRDKIIALIKSLPKSIRKSFVPAPNYADACINALQDKSVSLISALTRQLHRMSGVPLPDDMWQEYKIDEHYLMNFRIVDEQGKALAMGRDLIQLKAQLKNHTHQQLSELDNRQFERTNITDWDFGQLPEAIEVQQGGLSFKVYPALIDEHDTVSLKLLDNLPAAIQRSRLGLRRLFMLTARQNIKYLAKNLPNIDKMCLYYAGMDTCEHLKDDLITASVDEALFGKWFDAHSDMQSSKSSLTIEDEPEMIRTQEEFVQQCAKAKQQLIPIANQYSEIVFACLQAYHHIIKLIKQHTALNQLQSISDINEQLSWLIYPNFVVHTPKQWLEHLPRYLHGIEIRLQKLQQSLAADQQRQNQLQPYWRRLAQQMQIDRETVKQNREWRHYRWMLEEMRISLFAQNLKTAIPVSNKRLEEQLAKIKKG